MRELLSDVRSELAADADRVPWLLPVIGALIALAPLAVLGDGLVDVVVSVAAVLFLARSFIERDFGWVREPWVTVALLLWGFLVLRGVLSVDPERSAVKGLLWIRFIVFAAAVQVTLVRSGALRKAVLAACATVAVFGAADALFQFVFGFDVFGRVPTHAGRLNGPLQNPAIGLVILFVGLPAIAMLLQRTASDWSAGKWPWLSVGLLALIYAAIVLSGERMVFIQSVISFALLLILIFRLRLTTLLALGLAGIALIGVFLAAFPQIRERHLSTITQVSHASESIYIRAMLAGVEVFKDHPVFGVGLKNFRAHCAEAVEDTGVREACKLIHPHQVWLHIGAETGLVGAIGFLALFVLGLWPAIRLWRSWGITPLLAGATIAVLWLLVPFATSGNFFSNWREGIFWLLFGIAVALGRVVSTRAEREPGALPDKA